MLRDTRIALLLLSGLVAALQANDPDTFKRWLYGGIQDLGEPADTTLLSGDYCHGCSPSFSISIQLLETTVL